MISRLINVAAEPSVCSGTVPWVFRCHDIEFGDLDRVISETLPALQLLKAKGLVRHIGITGLPLKVFRYVLDRAPPGESDRVQLGQRYPVQLGKRETSC